MNKQTLKNLTDSHGWLGIVISGVLFLIFFAGSISLFRYEIFQWSLQPTHEVTQGKTLSVSDVMKIAIKGQPFNAKEHLTVLPPSEKVPYYRVYIDLIEAKAGRESIGLIIHPITGRIIDETEQYYLADFIYRLHRDLNLSKTGGYFIGIVTLFFAFMLISGIFIHARKLVSNFFQYRAGKHKRSQFLDMHNVIGTISLPFTIMYALSGLIFNLVIIYQIAFAVILYKGDQQLLLADAGIHNIKPVWQDKPTVFNNIDNLSTKYAVELGQTPTVVRMYNYGDKSAVMHIMGAIEGTFSQEYDIAISLYDEVELHRNDKESYSVVRYGTAILSELHFGSFASIDIRLVYLFLGVIVCILIVTGNILWLQKRQRKINASRRSISLVTKMTLISTLGVGASCCSLFLIERLIPLHIEGRADYIIYGFIFSLILLSALSFFIRNQTFLVLTFATVSMTLIMAVIADWLMYYKHLYALYFTNDMTVFAVQLGLIVSSLGMAYIGYLCHLKQPLSGEFDNV